MNNLSHLETLFTRYRDNTISRQELDQLLLLLDRPGSEEKIKQWIHDAHWEELSKEALPGDGNGKGDKESKVRFQKMLEEIKKRQKKFGK